MDSRLLLPGSISKRHSRHHRDLLVSRDNTPYYLMRVLCAAEFDCVHLNSP